MTEHNPINEQSKQKALDSFRQEAGEYLTTNEGVRINNTNDSLKAGERGATLIEDFHFHCDRSTSSLDEISKGNGARISSWIQHQHKCS